MLFQLIFDEESLEYPGGNKILEIHDELGRDYSFLVDYDRCYFSFNEIKAQMAEKLAVNVSEIQIEEI